MKKFAVLNIDDDKITLMLHGILVKSLKLPLEVFNFECAEATIDFLNTYKEIDNTYFFIMLDINMPGMSGWDFLNFLKARPEIQCTVAMITSSIDGRDREIAAEYDLVSCFYVKPINRQDVNTFLTQGGMFDEVVI